MQRVLQSLVVSSGVTQVDMIRGQNAVCGVEVVFKTKQLLSFPETLKPTHFMPKIHIRLCEFRISFSDVAELCTYMDGLYNCHM